MVVTDYESTEGVSFALLIGIAGLIVSLALATFLLAHHVLTERETELRELNDVLDGVGLQ